jgi:hypothetical protein
MMGQIGAPLEESDLAAMPAEKSAFLREFFEKAEAEIETAEAKGEEQPYTPSPELREKYIRVVGELESSHYCSVRQLEVIFNFSKVS